MSESPQLLRPRRLLLRVAFLLLIPVAWVAVPGFVTDPVLASVLPLFVAYFFLALAPLVLGREIDLFAPPVLTGLLAAFSTGGTALSFILVDELRLPLIGAADAHETAQVAERALYVLIIGTLSYFAGYYSRAGLRLRWRFPRVAGRVWNRRRLFIATIAPALLSIAAYAVFQSRLGVSLFDVTQLGAGKSVWRDDTTLSWMLRSIEFALVPMLLYVTDFLAHRRLSRVIPVVAVAIVVGLLVMRIGQRGPIVYAALTLVIVFHYLRRRVPVVVFVAAVFVAMAASNLILEWRIARTGVAREFNLTEALSDPSQVLIGHEQDRQRFGVLSAVVNEFPEHRPLLLGESWLSLVVLPIPRWLWPEKAEHFQWQDNRIVFQITGVPAPTPFVGVLYANLSWIGIFLGMFLYGAFHRGLYEWLRFAPRDPSVVLLYALFLRYFEPTTAGVSTALLYILPVLLFLRFVGDRRPAPLSPAALPVGP